MSEDTPSTTSKSIAFFDLDLTLLSQNSARMWMRRARRKKKISKRFIAKGMFWLFLYQLGVTRLERALEKGITSLRGTHEKELERSIEEFWNEEVVHTLREKGRHAIEKHQKNGERCVLLTSSSVYLAQHAETELGLDDALSTVFEVENGVLTGNTEGPICYGKGKLQIAKAYAEKYKTTLAHCTFYTDSYSDVPVLKEVGHPVAVHPDPRLTRLAEQKGWPVVFWDAASIGDSK